ncbi:MAG: hypothetical protein ACRDHP_09125 [Ktedonobacterales bacterium]
MATAEGARHAHMRRWRWLPLELAGIVAALAATRFLSINLWLLPNGDVQEYYNYAIAFWTWHPYFHNLPVEYPPLAIVPFTLTLLPPILDYQTTFALWMGLLVVLGYFGFLRYSTRARGLIYVFYLVLGAAATLLARFDIVPALVTLAALWAVGRRRFGLAYALLAAGILLKLYPAFLVPVVAIEQWRVISARAVAEGQPAPLARLRAWRKAPGATLHWFWEYPGTRRVALGLGFCAALVVLAFACALSFNPNGALSGFQYAGARPLQIESTPATLLWLGSLVGIPAGPNYSFTSLNFVGPLDVALKPLSAVALAGGCLWVYWRQARGKLSPGRAFLACLCIVLVTNKIFSPQYIIWVLPIVAETEGFDLLWVAICFLTTLDFPILYQLRHPIWTVSYTPLFMPVLALRNGLLLWVTGRVLLRCTQGIPRNGISTGQEAAGELAAWQDGHEDSQPALAR